MTVIRWIVWEEGDRVAGIDFNHEVDVEVRIGEVRIRDRDAVTRVHTREEYEAEMARCFERAEEAWAACEAEAFG